MGLREYLFIALFFGVPGVLGAWLAHARGKNPLLWGLVSAPFPFFVEGGDLVFLRGGHRGRR
jgi:hypothetical protein